MIGCIRGANRNRRITACVADAIEHRSDQQVLVERAERFLRVCNLDFQNPDAWRRHPIELAEITLWLEQHPRSYDVVLSADTLVYFGELLPVLRASHAVLRPGGWVGFTLEASLGGESGFELTPSGRYRHRQDYVEQALEAAGCLTDTECRGLDDAYRFLRKVEHRLQLLFDLATHRLPEGHR